MGRPARYTRFAGLYNLVSMEPIYRTGRRLGIGGLKLRPGDHVLDIGCGTGHNFPLLEQAIGEGGHIVGVDLSAQMLEQAARRVERQGWGNVSLVRANAETLDQSDLTTSDVESAPRAFDAVLFTYSLSLMTDWPQAWRQSTTLARDQASVSVVDMQLPQARARWLSPLARLACALGGSDIMAHPWTVLERETTHVKDWTLRGGHIQVRAGTLVPGKGERT
jgi:demethylmenaquinone methyltransferase/2-methoxy-6-polyprenyl-1,4-benzoquinol methylase